MVGMSMVSSRLRHSWAKRWGQRYPSARGKCFFFCVDIMLLRLLLSCHPPSLFISLSPFLFSSSLFFFLALPLSSSSSPLLSSSNHSLICGREGPIVHIGAIVGAAMSQASSSFFKFRFQIDYMRHFRSVGEFVVKRGGHWNADGDGAVMARW